jgi:hypothetical protein
MGSELPVCTIDVLEANVVSIRADLNELKTDFRAAVAGIARVERQQLADRIATQFSELRADNKSLREGVDNNFQMLLTKIETDSKETRTALAELTKVVLRIDSRQSAILWVGGGLVWLITLAITAGKAFKWF